MSDVLVAPLVLSSLGREKSGGKKKRGGELSSRLPGVEGGVTWLGDVRKAGVEVATGSGVRRGVSREEQEELKLQYWLVEGVGGFRGGELLFGLSR